MFFADLKSTSNTTTASPTKQEVTYSKIEIKEEEEVDGYKEIKKKSFEEEVKEIMENPGRKRRRVTVVKTEKVEIKGEAIGEPQIVVEGDSKKQRKRKKLNSVKEEVD